jgi:uncharacterized protein
MPKKLPRVLLDTGLLVALYDRSDTSHSAAVKWLQGFEGCFLSVEAVLTEAAFFISAPARAALAEQVADGWIELQHPDAAGYKRIATILRKYADQDPDFADACLVWLAETSGIHSIVTVDVQDFSAYRIGGRSKFDLIPWQQAAY